MKPVLPSQLGIKSIYTSNFLHTTLWAFVTGQRMNNTPVNEAIRNYMQHFDVFDLDFGALKVAYYNKDKEFRKCASDISKDAKDVFDVKPDEVEKVFSCLSHMVKSRFNGK